MRCKPTTAGGYRYALDKVLLPAFGSPPLGASAAIRWRLCTIGSTRRRPWRTGWWACSRGCFNMAEAWGMALEGGNPCRSVKKYRNRNCKRFPSKQEVPPARKGAERGESEGKMSGSGVAAVRLLMLTGGRRNEILTLRWEHVDLEAGELRLRPAPASGQSPGDYGVPDTGRRLANLNV